MEIIIRHANNSDLHAILDIVNNAILNTTANYSYEPQSLEMQQQWFDLKQHHHFPVIVAQVGHEVIGFGTYGTFRERFGYRFTVEHSVYVTTDFIAKGIGSQLLSELIRLATAQNYHVMIGGIDAGNKESIAFHKKFGFVECGIITEAAFKFDKWLDLLFMQLILRNEEVLNDE